MMEVTRMSDYGITKENLLSALPPVLAKDKSMSALADSIADKLVAQNSDIDAIRIYTALRSLPENLCDILAKDFKIDWYGYNLPLEVKRQQIANSFSVHRMLGTVGAMHKALSDIYPETSVEEWFDYGGDPYHFRIVLNVSRQRVNDFSDVDLRKSIAIYKRLSARLDEDNVIFKSQHWFLLVTSAGYVPYTVRQAGTTPKIARQGAIAKTSVVAETSAHNSQVYSTPAAGTIETGTYPATATQGATVSTDISAMVSHGDVTYTVPATGEIATGTYPEISTAGEIAESGLMAITDGSGGYLYDVPLCGDSLIF
jgi:phage tail P2-like protein